MAATTDYDFDGTVALVTGAAGALGSAVVETLDDAGATVAGTDVVDLEGDDAQLDPGDPAAFYRGDLTDPADAEAVVDAVVDEFGRLDHLVNVAGTWQGGDPLDETDPATFDLLFDVNLKTMFLASKFALPQLRAGGEGEGAGGGSIVSVSARASLEGGEGDGPYRAAKAGVRILTETIAEENLGTVRANAVLPSVIDTPANREMLPDADHESWVDPADIAGVVVFLLSDAAAPTSGAAVPVYGEA